MSRSMGIAVGIGMVTLASCSIGSLLGSTTAESPNEISNWTIVVYMCGDNELESRALADINEMEAVNMDGSGVRVIAAVDRAVGYDATDGDWRGTRLFAIDHDPEGANSRIISPAIACPQIGIDSVADNEVDLTEPSTLSALLHYTAIHYPSRKHALIVWGQGSGWRSVGYDTSSDDHLYTPELADALGQTQTDVIALDTSFGANLELAYELRFTGAVLIGSQDQVNADGWRYDAFLSALSNGDGTVASFAEAAHAAYQAEYDGYPFASISTIDLGRIGEVAAATNQFAQRVAESISGDLERDALLDAYFYDVEDFYATPGDLSIDLYDLADVTETVVGQSDSVGGTVLNDVFGATHRLRTAIDDAVIRSWSGSANPRAHGLSIHLIPLLSNGAAAATHDDAYIRGRPVEDPLDFVRDSAWVPDLAENSGLLYHLFYALSGSQ